METTVRSFSARDRLTCAVQMALRVGSKGNYTERKMALVEGTHCGDETDCFSLVERLLPP